eukprot:10758694-Alexandrium_andersonii.AAC.1
MSASLVGSEMCIRDSGRGTSSSGWRASDRGPAGPAFKKRRTPAPVSSSSSTLAKVASMPGARQRCTPGGGAGPAAGCPRVPGAVSAKKADPGTPSGGGGLTAA